MKVQVEDLQKWIERIFVAAKLPHEHAILAADVFVRATLRGLGHHDVSYLPQRLFWLENEGVNPCPIFQPVVKTSAAEIWDADGALGEVACRIAVDKAIHLARFNGIGYCVVRRSNHFLAAAPYTEIANEAGCFALIWSNTNACMAFPGGASQKIGNNPLGFSFPLPYGESLSADLCLAYSSLGNLKYAAQEHQIMPSYWGVDSQGKQTSNPEELLKGAMRPIGEHKGFALALLGEMISGLIAGGNTLDQITAPYGINTHNQALLVWDLERLGGLKEAQERGLDFNTRLKSQMTETRLPGERSKQFKIKGLKEGLLIDQETWKTLTDWSMKNHVDLPTTI